MKKLLFLSTTMLLFVGSNAQSTFWHQVSSGTNDKLLSISFGAPQAGYISGANGVLLRSLNGGATWSPLAYSGLNLSASAPDIIHVNFITAATGYAIVGNVRNPVYSGSLYETNDSGKTWTGVNPGNIAASRTFFFDANNGFAIGSAFFAGQTVIKQTAGTWGAEQHFSFDPSRFLYGIDFTNSGTGIVGGDSGYVYRTFNGGTSWDTVKTITDSTINTLKFLNDHTILGGTDNNGNAVIISYDTGRTWQFEMNTLTFSYPDIKSIAVSKRDSFIAVGHAQLASAGIILWFQNGHIYNESEPQHLNAVAMQNDSIAYVVGDSGLILTNRVAAVSAPQITSNAMGLRIYPNPAARICYSEARYPHTLRLYDVAGRLVLSDAAAVTKHTLVLNMLNPGIFIVEAQNEHCDIIYQTLVVK